MMQSRQKRREKLKKNGGTIEMRDWMRIRKGKLQIQELGEPWREVGVEGKGKIKERVFKLEFHLPTLNDENE